MSLRPPPKVALQLARLLPEDCEFLVGDLVEDYQRGRSRVWFWTQVVSAVLTRAGPRLGTTYCEISTVESALASLAILVVLAFEIVVGATLLDRVFTLSSFIWAAQTAHLPWVALVCASALAVAFAVAPWSAGGSRSRLRTTLALGCAASATAMAFITLQVAHPLAPRPFLPSAASQVGIATIFVCGLLVGFNWSLGRLALRGR